MVSKVFEPTPRWNCPHNRIFRSRVFASKSWIEKSEDFSVVSCNLRVFLFGSNDPPWTRQIEHLKPWSARPSPSWTLIRQLKPWSENEQKPYSHVAALQCGWLAVVGKHFCCESGGFLWEVSMCQNLAPMHWQLSNLDKGNRETVCKVQCEMFSGHWVSATCKTCVLPESLATGIQDLLAAANLVQTPGKNPSLWACEHRQGGWHGRWGKRVERE